VSSVVFQCQWGSTWTQTLGLTFGRSATSSFPYIGAVAYPQLRASARDLPGYVPCWRSTLTTPAV
jgi:hypothetical protein